MIIYFTGTGNSEYIANEIAKGTDDYTINMIDLMDQRKTEITIKEGENFGFVCPTYWYGLPTVVEDFLSQVTFTMEGTGHYTYFVGHYGNVYGCVFTVAQKAFHLKGIDFNAYYGILTVGNWGPYYQLKNPDYIRSALESERGGIDEAVVCISEKYQNEPYPDQYSQRAYIYARNHYNEIRDTSLFRLDGDKCIGCGMCEESCPVHAIKIQDGRPIWAKDKCTVCLSCLSRCPAEAIDYEEGFLVYGRHVHP